MVKEFWKSVDICPSYGQESSVLSLTLGVYASVVRSLFVQSFVPTWDIASCSLMYPGRFIMGHSSSSSVPWSRSSMIWYWPNGWCSAAGQLAWWKILAAYFQVDYQLGLTAQDWDPHALLLIFCIGTHTHSHQHVQHGNAFTLSK